MKTKVTAFYTSTNVPLSITKISKPFYDQKFSGIQTALDGDGVAAAPARRLAGLALDGLVVLSVFFVLI